MPLLEKEHTLVKDESEKQGIRKNVFKEGLKNISCFRYFFILGYDSNICETEKVYSREMGMIKVSSVNL